MTVGEGEVTAAGLRVLVVEDADADAELMLNALRRFGFVPDPTQVQDEAEFVRALGAEPEVVLADYRLPRFSAMRAIELRNELARGIPLLVVSGTIGEDAAVAALRAGAEDYVLKDRLDRLGPAVGRALERARAQARQASEERAAREREVLFRRMFQAAPVGMAMVDSDGVIRQVNSALAAFLGYLPEELVGRSFTDVVHPDDADGDGALTAQLLRGVLFSYDRDKRFVHRDGSVVWGRLSISPVPDEDGSSQYAVGMVADITAQHRAEEELQLVHDVAVAAGSAPDLNSALGTVIEKVCATGFWDFGQAWIADETAGKLVASILWHGAGAALEEFRRASEALRIVPGEGIAGLVWQTGNAVSVSDISADERYLRRRAAEQAGLRAAVLVPVRDQDVVVAVLEFMSCRRAADERRLVDMVQAVASQIGGIMLRKRAEAQARRAAAIVDSSDDAISSMTLDGIVTSWNPGAATLYGYQAGEMLGRPVRVLIPLELQDEARVSYARVVTGEAIRNLETVRLAKDGRRIDVSLTISPIHDDTGEVGGIATIARDITAGKQAATQLADSYDSLRRADEDRRRLLSRLVTAQEEERRRIASDIHDDSIQMMTAAAMRLEMLARRLPEGEEAKAVTKLQDTVRLAITRLRHLLFELRPPALDREGLVPALRMHLEQLSGEISLDYEVVNELGTEPDDATRVILYRIAQEALANVRRHAEATTVRIRLSDDGRGFRVQVEDDGRGFDPSVTSRPRLGHLGLPAMRERAEMAGGWCQIRSLPGAGTTVDFWVPADAAGSIDHHN